MRKEHFIIYCRGDTLYCTLFIAELHTSRVSSSALKPSLSSFPLSLSGQSFTLISFLYSFTASDSILKVVHTKGTQAIQSRSMWNGPKVLYTSFQCLIRRASILLNHLNFRKRGLRNWMCILMNANKLSSSARTEILPKDDFATGDVISTAKHQL